MGMFDDDSYNEGINVGRRIAIGSVVASVAVLGILGITVLMNSNNSSHNNKNSNPYAAASEESTEEPTEYEKDKETRTSDELSFWNMYDKEEPEPALVVSENKEKKEKKISAPSKNAVSKNKAGISSNDASVSANKFNIKPLGEKPEYVSVNAIIPKSELIDESFKMEKGRLLYSQGGRSVSHFGIDVSKYNGTVSWNKVKQDGVEFALLRVGARGYSTGNIVLDENFSDNLKSCSQNGIDVGVYFFSQAINTYEAIEEANYCVAALGGKKIRYPVIFDSEKIMNDSYRTENLTSTELTNIFKAFADTVKAYGYTPMVAGTKEQLALHFDLESLSGYDVWLLDIGEKTEYPYRYTIRQYANDGKINGINGNVNYNICLISYADK